MFIKIIKEPGTSFQSPTFSQKHVRKVCDKVHQYVAKFYFDSTQDSKEISKGATFIMQQYLYDDVRHFPICGFHKNTKI